jgi:hypothetical protein
LPASLAHPGAELVRRGQTERLPPILETIGERGAPGRRVW